MGVGEPHATRPAFNYPSHEREVTLPEMFISLFRIRNWPDSNGFAAPCAICLRLLRFAFHVVITERKVLSSRVGPE